MNPVNEIRFCKYCQERTLHYGPYCSQCESTSDIDSDTDYDSEDDPDFIVSDIDSDSD